MLCLNDLLRDLNANITDGVLQLFSFELRSVLMIEWGCYSFYQTGNMFMIVTVDSSRHPREEG